jgi:phosphomannomutase / phosphoglucomutase
MGAPESMNTPERCFKAYDIRGQIPEDLNEDIAWRIGHAYAEIIQPGTVVVGRDARLESPSLADALMQGLNTAGARVIDIGLCGTEEIYFQTFHRESEGVGGGIMVTASHNPKGYNGMKLVRQGSRPVSGDTGLFAIRDRAAQLSTAPNSAAADHNRSISVHTDKTDYISHILGYVDHACLKPLKIVADPGNGTAGLVIEQIAMHLPFDITLINATPDGEFPNGVPNPLLPEMRSATTNAVIQHGADFGLAWDGDFDRCFFFDETGDFIEGYYIVGLLAEAFLAIHPGSKIIHDPRLTWNTIDIVQRAGGTPIQSKTGHAFIKERMRQEDAIYGGEMSAHHYFRDFAYCDSGMIPWLLVAQLISQTGKSLSQLVGERMAAFPCSGEINYRVKDAPATVDRVLAYYAPLKPQIDKVDGISLEFPDWRFNLRSSNTESLLRLNVESRGNADAVSRHLSVLENLIKSDLS